jgi:hypothetical protein
MNMGNHIPSSAFTGAKASTNSAINRIILFMIYISIKGL